ncbi:hypothetical protein ACFXPZ_17255 [Streptomyces sp. NPDC059101]|uniref:hypothetical protein n=1 Tax=Streptomyces sp. NPDC059101 TaxID=3346728 RepID=UPI0036B3BFF4
MTSGLGAQAVAQRLAERLARVLERFGAFLYARVQRTAGVEAALRAEADVHGLRDDVRDHGLECRDGRFLDRLEDRVEDLLLGYLEEPSYDDPRRSRRASDCQLGQSEGERCRRLSRDDFRCEDRQLGDHRDFHADDESGSGIQRDGDDLRHGARVGEIARATGELLPRAVESIDGVAGVLGDHIAGSCDALLLEALYSGREVTPLLGALHQLVFVCRGPVEAHHFKDPFKCARQHQRHGCVPPTGNNSDMYRDKGNEKA